LANLIVIHVELVPDFRQKAINSSKSRDLELGPEHQSGKIDKDSDKAFL